MTQTNTKHAFAGFFALSGRHAVLPCLLLALALAGCARSTADESRITQQPSMAGVKLPPAGSDPYMRDVRALADADFEVRMRAARTLVDAGPAALPALGRAGDLKVPVAGGMEVSATESVVGAIVAQADENGLATHLGSPWPNVRRAAATEVGERDVWASIPRLIERLDDRDREVRAASAASLRRLTNQWFGYRASASVGNRRTAADRWRQWWTVEGGARERARTPHAAIADR